MNSDPVPARRVRVRPPKPSPNPPGHPKALPYATEFVGVRLPVFLVRAIDAVAERYGLSKVDVIRAGLRTGLASAERLGIADLSGGCLHCQGNEVPNR